MQNIFNKHPNEHNMSYTQHLMFSLSLATQFSVASIKAVIHGFCPFLFETSSRDYSYFIFNSIDKKKHS
jgi:hypothetical protein